MKIFKKIILILLFIAVFINLFTIKAYSAELPDGWWPVWSAYQQAVENKTEDEILKEGDKVISFYSNYPLNTKIANQLYMVYYTRQKNLIFEKRNQYDQAIENNNKLIEICQYLNDNGQNYTDMIRICNSRMDLVTPKSGIYALSNTQSNSYGSMIAPSSGTYYGAIPTSEYFNDKSVCSFYVELETETAAKYKNWISSKDNGDRTIQVCLNFKGEGTCAKEIPTGKYDKSIEETLSYLNTLKSGVLLRIGAEFDVWTDLCDADTFIEAYEYIANKARMLAPNVELVWSPNSSSGFYVDMEDYYPNTNLVDWVGVSLYCIYGEYDTMGWVEYCRKCDFADPLIKIQQVYKIAEHYNKPVIISESGSRRNEINDGTYEKWSSSKMAKEFSSLNMMYPRVKAIVCFDRDMEEGGFYRDYRIKGDTYNAVSEAINNNPSLTDKASAKAGTWVNLEDFNELPQKELLIGSAGFTYNDSDLKAEYSIDGKIYKTDGAPNYLKINLNNLSKGNHVFKAKLYDKNGYIKVYKYLLKYDKTISFTKINTIFSDVSDENIYYYDAVYWGHNQGIVKGTSNTTFSPDKTCTRAEILTFLWRMEGCPKSDTKTSFIDVPQSAYYSEAVSWAYKNEITKGTSQTTFSPDKTCTRAEIITLIWRLKGQTIENTNNNFTDIQKNTYYYHAVNWGYTNKIINGTSKTTFSPNKSCTRAEAITMLYRLAL